MESLIRGKSQIPSSERPPESNPTNNENLHFPAVSTHAYRHRRSQEKRRKQQAKPKASAGKKQAKKERDDRRDAINESLDEKDKNIDGCISRDEFLAGESDHEAAGKRFDEPNKNSDRSLTKSEIAKTLGID